MLHELHAAQFHSYSTRLKAEPTKMFALHLHAIKAEMDKAAGPMALLKEYRKAIGIAPADLATPAAQGAQRKIPAGFAGVSNDSAAARTSASSRAGGGGGFAPAREEEVAFTSMEEEAERVAAGGGDDLGDDAAPIDSRFRGYAAETI